MIAGLLGLLLPAAVASPDQVAVCLDQLDVACAERVLLPRLREADDSTVVLADGFSCRTQVHEFDGGGPPFVST